MVENRHIAMLLIAGVMILMLAGCGSGGDDGFQDIGLAHADDYRSDKDGICIGKEPVVIYTHTFAESGVYFILVRVSAINNESYNIQVVPTLERNGIERIAKDSSNISRDEHYSQFILSYIGYFWVGESVDVVVKADASKGLRERSIVIPYEENGDIGRNVISIMKIDHFFLHEPLT